jgi:eukaryotic-like serine/threonine-protein kinase
LTDDDTDARRERERKLSLDFECLQSVAGGINEVRVWYDGLLGVERVGKRIDLATVDDGALPEPETLQSIDHANIVPITSAARVAGYQPPMSVIEIITPYYKRGSITDALLNGESFTPRETVRIITATLSGLRELHEVHHIVHRDIKSGNVLLSEGYPWAVLADLGLAGRMNDQGWASALNNPTLYSPPEFVTTGRLDAASDIYPMGLIMRELLGGHFPYETYTTSDIVDKLMKVENPVRPADRELPVWTPRDLRRIHNKATEKHHSQRYQSAREMADALSRARVVDWKEVDANQWEAPFLHSDRRVRVEAVWKDKKNQYCLTTRAKKRVWRRAYDDIFVAQLNSPDARAVFDQATALACAS